MLTGRIDPPELSTVKSCLLLAPLGLFWSASAAGMRTGAAVGLLSLAERTDAILLRADHGFDCAEIVAGSTNRTTRIMPADRNARGAYLRVCEDSQTMT